MLTEKVILKFPDFTKDFVLFVFMSLTVSASRLIDRIAQIELLRLLFGAGLQIFIVTPQMFRFSREHIENVRG